MSLNIESPETDALARELSERTGESLDTAVTAAIRERLERVRREGVAGRLLELGRQFSSGMSEETRNFDIDKELYDERGLPK